MRVKVINDGIGLAINQWTEELNAKFAEEVDDEIAHFPVMLQCRLKEKLIYGKWLEYIWNN